jgi:hypothetical protein
MSKRALTTRTSNDSSGGTSETFLKSKQLLAYFSRSSNVGICFCDTNLRIQSVNNALSKMNGVPVEEQQGKTLGEVLGAFAPKVERAFESVLRTRKPILWEAGGKLPARAELGYWLANYFPLRDSTGKIDQVGVVALEVTEQKELQESLRVLSGKLLRTKMEEQRRIAKELRRAIEQYHATLKNHLRDLIEPISNSQDKSELLMQSIERLDHFPVISFSKGPSSGIFQQIERSPKIRGDLFRKFVEKSNLQNDVFEALAKHPDIQRRILKELATVQDFRRKLLRLTGSRGHK